MKDLLILVADKDMEQTLQGLLERYQSFGLQKEIAFDIYIIPNHDNGWRKVPEIIRPLRNNYKKYLVLFDKDGSGREKESTTDIEKEIKEEIVKLGISSDDCECIAIDPELEIWIWAKSPHVSETLGWGNDYTALKDFLEKKGLWKKDQPKPNKPKEAVEFILRNNKIPRSSSLYKKIASKVSWKNCEVESFKKFETTIQKYFGE